MRDLQKDLEICDRATSGPWLMAEEPEVILENTFSQPVILSAVCFYDDLGASKVEAIQANDLEFIIQAREGWPHAIERALKAERALGNETILNGKALAKLNERALKAESLARELAKEMELMRMAVNALLLGEDVPVEVVDRITLGVSSVLLKAREVLGDE